MSAQTYLVTARKYRPQLFSELVAQDHVTETLKNAIRLDRVAHAYLFSGPRGVGKTTAARILAKAVNCTTPLEDREANAEPCRRCESCETFEQSRSLNIIEIDAASNNRVDDIRDLRETVRIPPQGGLRKVYIVDEVHMLSTAAFNALLKTLEEPPAHVLFIFATTEPHKVLPTILSRCQRFDFRRIAVPEIVARLNEICEREDILIDEASLMLIARKGDGALRDALSVFDQAVSLCGSSITYSELARALGVVDVDRYFEVTDKIVRRDTAGMLRLVEQTVRAGHDLQEFLAGLAEHLRNLLVAQTMQETGLIEAAEATRQRYGDAAQQFTEPDLLRLLTLAADAGEAIKASMQPRLKVETLLLKMASLALGADLREAIAKIDRLEQLAREGKLPAPGHAAEGAASSHRDAGSRSASAAGGSEGASAAADEKPRASARASDETAPAAADEKPRASARTSDETAPAAADEKPRASARTSDETAPAASSTPMGETPRPASSATPDDRPQPASSHQSESPRSTAVDGAAGVFGKPALRRRPEAVQEAAASDEAGVDVCTGAGPVAAIWGELLDRVKKDKIQVWSLLHHTEPEGYDDGMVRIAVPNDFHRRVLASQAGYVLQHLEPLVDVPLRTLQFTIREEIDGRKSEETASDFDPYEYMKRKRQENQVVRAIFEQFGGELVW